MQVPCSRQRLGNQSDDIRRDWRGVERRIEVITIEKYTEGLEESKDWETELQGGHA